jgi:hypothetical protein
MLCTSAFLSAQASHSRLILRGHSPPTPTSSKNVMAPKLTQAEPLSAQCNIRFTPTELAELKEAANIAGITVSTYVRRRALGRKIAANVDLIMIRELRRIGGLLKHIHNESGGAYSDLTANTLIDIQKAIVSFTVNK